MKVFIIRLQDGNYLMNVRLISTYLDYDRTPDFQAAHRLNDFDSRLVIQRLWNAGVKTAVREEVTPDK